MGVRLLGGEAPFDAGDHLRAVQSASHRDVLQRSHRHQRGCAGRVDDIDACPADEARQQLYQPRHLCLNASLGAHTADHRDLLSLRRAFIEQPTILQQEAHRYAVSLHSEQQ